MELADIKRVASAMQKENFIKPPFNFKRGSSEERSGFWVALCIEKFLPKMFAKLISLRFKMRGRGALDRLRSSFNYYCVIKTNRPFQAHVIDQYTACPKTGQKNKMVLFPSKNASEASYLILT